MSRLDAFHDSVRKHGSAEAALEEMFPGGSTTSTPWRHAGGLKTDFEPEYRDAKQGAINKVLAAPPDLQDVDPRNLTSTQPSITKGGMRHYLNGNQWHQTGETFGDKGNAGNQYPTIYRRARDKENVILSGHHRAAAALMQGVPLKARIVEGP